MSNVLLKYTPQTPKDKTEVILTTQKYIQKTQTFSSSIQMNGCDTASSTSVQNLGVALDQTLSSNTYPICQTCYLQLCRISSVRHYLTHDALICTFILSHIYYRNSLLAGCPKNLICKFQKVHNLPTSSVILPGLTIYLILCALH